jgi:hypothetical protein
LCKFFQKPNHTFCNVLMLFPIWTHQWSAITV